MKTLYTLVIGLLFLSCSRQEEESPKDYEQYISATIKSYSINYGHSGQEVIIYGEHFTTDLSKITLKFDDVSAKIISTSLSEIKCILPVTSNPIPELNLAITNKVVHKSVTNEYYGNIGILPSINYNKWTILNKSLGGSIELKINKIQQLSATEMYLTIPSGTGGLLIYTNDGGLTWKKIDENWANLSAFHMSSKPGFGFNYNGINIRKINDFTNIQMLNHLGFLNTLYVDDTLNNATAITSQGVVFTTNDGINFNQVYEASNNKNLQINLFYYPVNEKLSNNHIWAGGRNKIRVNWTDKYFPFLLFKNNTTEGWKEYSFHNDIDYVPSDIIFLNETQGFFHSYEHNINANQNRLTSKIYSTSNGGDSWSLIYTDMPFFHMTFKDKKVGWAISSNKIFKTTNGGVSWQLDYTHTQELKNISYKNGAVWTFSKDHILKFFIQ
ncbi:IPT/TIG domain-containing protein [Flavobacterium sp.]|uniref:IPT/TIG domain-containing protein n=1 Tax=Flavobacterium sp. TaxID=239 RepID=UPI003D1349E6